MQVIKNDSATVKRPRQSIRTPEGMLRNFLMRVIGPRKLKELYSRLGPVEQARFIIAMMPFVQGRKAAEPFSEEEIDKLYSLIEKKATDEQKNIV